jgi:hypothetical protein
MKTIAKALVGDDSDGHARFLEVIIAPSGERKDKIPGDVILVQPGNLAGDACP